LTKPIAKGGAQIPSLAGLFGDDQGHHAPHLTQFRAIAYPGSGNIQRKCRSQARRESRVTSRRRESSRQPGHDGALLPHTLKRLGRCLIAVNHAATISIEPNPADTSDDAEIQSIFARIGALLRAAEVLE
jgi:hypothetical protein